LKLYQKISSKRSNSFLAFNPHTFAELVEETSSSYIFNLTFRVLIDENKKIFDHDAVELTVKSKEDVDVSYGDSGSNFSSEVSERDINPTQGLVGIGNGYPRPKYTEKVKNRLFSSLVLLNEIQKKEPFLFQETIGLSNYFSDVKKNVKYNFTELFAKSYKPIRQQISERNLRLSLNAEDKTPDKTISQTNPTSIDPLKVIQRVNREVCGVTDCLDDSSINSLTSESFLEDSKIRMHYVERGKKPLYFDSLKYFLREIGRNPEEKSQTWYETRKVTKNLNYVEIEKTIEIKKSNKNLNLTVRIDLYEKGVCSPSETLNVDLYVPSHIEAYQNVYYPPSLTVHQDFLSKKSNSKATINVLNITDNNSSSRVTSFNIYKKNIDDKGSVEKYQLLGTVENTSKVNEFYYKGDSNLSVVRVIPVDRSGNEVNVFSSIVVGPGHKTIGSICIVPCHFGKNEIRIDVFNVPEDAVSLTLYRRNCTDNFNSSFVDIKEMRINKNNDVAYFVDQQVKIGEVYEYYVVASVLSQDKKEEIPSYSNYAIYKNIPNGIIEKAVVVELTDQSTVAENGNITTSFTIKTVVNPSENERITQALKDQVGELYEQFLNPLANSSSPLKVDSKVFQYSDLFFHEVVRTNLNTGERETFDLVSDGKFIDNSESQNIFNIKPINPHHSYYYHVFSFRKNPLELFKSYVIRGTDSKGKEWFYLPYKWRNSSTKRGKLYADDENGIPVVSAYDSFTSESYGLTAVYRTDGSISYNDIENVIVERIDRNTNKIVWKFSEQENEILDIYDCFVVVKVVNGVRKILGKTQKSYIYHELTEEDLGTVYYIVVPIASDYKIDKYKFSNAVTIFPDGISKKSKV